MHITTIGLRARYFIRARIENHQSLTKCCVLYRIISKNHCNSVSQMKVEFLHPPELSGR